MTAAITIEITNPTMLRLNGRANVQARRMTRVSMLASFTASSSRGSST